jgi:putative membrane protein
MSTTSDSEAVGGEVGLRDSLAVDRTELASERTLLSYTRTGLGVGILGGSLAEIYHSLAAALTGWLFVAAGVATIAVGWWRFLTVRRHLRVLNRGYPEGALNEHGFLHEGPKAPR